MSKSAAGLLLDYNGTELSLSVENHRLTHTNVFRMTLKKHLG